jgi:hypothetical protein
MEIAEVTLAQIREKYSLPKTERDDAARFIAGISELLWEIKNKSRSLGMVPLLETIESRIQVKCLYIINVMWMILNSVLYAQFMIKDKAQALMNQRSHIEELQGLVRNTTAPMLQLKAAVHPNLLQCPNITWSSLI